MAKKKLNLISMILSIIYMFVIPLAIGGFFISGGFTGVIGLSYIPILIHQIIGWIIVIGSIIGLFKALNVIK